MSNNEVRSGRVTLQPLLDTVPARLATAAARDFLRNTDHASAAVIGVSPAKLLAGAVKRIRGSSGDSEPTI